jgi:UDPglucose--hexose-1-phosphate uridylyltransferase
MDGLLNDFPHRRWNPLTESWVLVSPHRAKRPWQGQVEKNTEESRPAYDPTCYLCPGNIRANGAQTPDYQDVFIFDNDFAAILPDTAPLEWNEDDLFRTQGEKGWCRVICFSPKHNLTIPEMEVGAIRKVIDLWKNAYSEMGAVPYIQHVQIFENKGAIQGCSNPHPHGQIWAQEHIPDEPLAKQQAQKKYFDRHGRTLLADYLLAERQKQERILFENKHFVVLVPFWAVWPFEAMIVPKRAMPNILAMTEEESDAFANAYQQLTIRYDNLFETSFPYSAGIHQAPTDNEPHPEWHWHMVFYPPLLRSATVKKFMVGYEMLAEPQRDITAEKAASILKALSSVHYKSKLQVIP